MIVLRQSDAASLPRGGAAAIGNFDGVHRGHARIIETLRARAAAVGGPAVVFTFDPHPLALLRPGAAPTPLSTTRRKAELLARLGVDALWVYPTSDELLRLAPERFFHDVIERQLGARALVEGPNFQFGRDRAGNIDTLARLCAAAGMTLDVVPPLLDGGEIISSSRARRLLAQGDMAAVNRLLTEPYQLRGRVAVGARRGATLGFPTANLAEVATLVPGHGVYAGAARVAAGGAGPGDVTPGAAAEWWAAAIHIGPNPTFAEAGAKIEAHLLDFAGVLYDAELELAFFQRLRDVRTFASVDELRGQLRQDVAAARRAFLAAQPPGA